MAGNERSARHQGGDPWGLLPGYHDIWGDWQAPDEVTASALRRAMGADRGDPDEPLPASPRVTFVVAGAGPARCGLERGTLVLEDDTSVKLRKGRLPEDLPLGYHRVVADGGRSGPELEHVIVVPDRAPRVAGARRWGITAQLYAARSTHSWGMGDLGDLARLGRWATGRGAATVGVNPLHAGPPVGDPTNSPYSPASRRWRDPIYLDLGALLDAGDLDDEVTRAARDAGARLNAGERIDRAQVWELKLRVLEHVWVHRRTDPVFVAARQTHGPALELWGTWCALAEVHGADWRRWPIELQRPASSAVARFAIERADRVGFWCWLQHLLDRQLAHSGLGRSLITDLAVGFAPSGFDAWEWQDTVALGCRVGAPPDLLGPDGQDWGLPPFIPWRLRELAYQPLAQTLRANLRHSQGLRIDHVMGLLRLYWIPPDRPAADGAYVGWQGTELLDIVALEAERAGAWIIGEDLGTVDEEIRGHLGDAGLLSTRLLWFEEDGPEHWPNDAMAAVTTHDLPTVAGVWTGTDLADQRAAGATTPHHGDALFRHRLRVAGACDDAAGLEHVVVAAHRAVASSPCVLATATLDDLVGAPRRPNIPGTVDEHPNWRIPLPVPLDQLPGHPLARSVTAAMAEQRPGPDLL
jgi:4-alpha-glucanotransferase